MFVRRGAAAAVVVSAVLLVGSGCEDPGPKGARGPSATASPTPSPSATPSAAVMPSVIGKKSIEAEAAVKAVVTRPVEARGAYSDVPLAPDHSGWTVCFQTPAAGAAVASDSAVELSLVAPGTPCPAKAGAPLHPSKAPTPAATPATGATPAPAPKPKTSGPTDTGTTGGDGGNGDGSTSTGGGGAGVYYKNCTEAKAAGAAPIRRGEPGYRSALDRDGDGTACDK
ncbi:excalibur calcium-binding domain-containing protein [Streptomyces sp. PvR034]|uniref:excalibur calcium-binding domain-containing protein n=1 Tax=Streptomyces sp. PvR034 TaxID=3156401 RepID=UPI003396E311